MDRFDRALDAAHLDRIADADRPLPHQDPAGNEVVDDVLRAKTDTDSHRARNEGESRKRNAEHAEDDQHEQHVRDDEIDTANKQYQVLVPLHHRQLCQQQLLDAHHQVKTEEHREEHDEHLAGGGLLEEWVVDERQKLFHDDPCLCLPGDAARDVCAAAF